MLASDPYLSHLVAASVQTAAVTETKNPIIATPPAAGAVSAAPAQAFTSRIFVLITAVVTLAYIALGHVAWR